MLKTLRIASIAAAAAAVCVVILVAVFGLKGDPEKEAYLAKEGIVSQYKAKAGLSPNKEDKVAPLVAQAKLFALRIDPPPPPPPPPSPKDTKVAKGDGDIKTPPPPPHPPPPTPAKYTLMGTAVYPEHPEKSLVLLKDIRNEYKWYRQGETLGNLTIQEIYDDRVVLYYNGQKNSELSLVKPKPIKSLLKGDSLAASAASVAAASSPVSPGMPTRPRPEAAPVSTPSRTIPSRMPSPAPAASPARSTGNVRTPPPMPTVKQQVESIDESIASIREIMSKEVEGADESEQTDTQAAWKDLIELLQREKENLQNAGESEGSDNNGLSEE